MSWSCPEGCDPRRPPVDARAYHRVLERHGTITAFWDPVLNEVGIWFDDDPTPAIEKRRNLDVTR